MTLREVGPDAFAAAPGKIHLTDRVRALTPHQVMHRRAKDDWQGLFGFTRGLKKRWTVTFDENRPDACFTAITARRSRAPRRPTNGITGRPIRGVRRARARSRSNAARPRAERAGWACLAARRSSRPFRPATKETG